MSEPAKRKNLPADARVLIADVASDITIPFFTTVLSPVDDTLNQKGQGKGLKLYDEIERDTHAHAVLQKRKHHLVAREWIVDAASDAPLDVEAADFVREVLPSLTYEPDVLDTPDQKLSGFDHLCLDLADATLKGFAIAEIVWTREGARIRPERVVSHEQRRFVFDRDWRPRLLTRTNMSEGIALPGAKFIAHRFGVKGNNPYGLGLGHRLFWAVLFKREGVAFWLHFLDRFAAPTPVGKYPIGMLEPQQRQLLMSLEQLANGTSVAVPLGTELDFLEAKRAGEAGYEKWCRYWDEQISECVLGETLTTNLQGQGSRAATETHSEILDRLVDADADLMSATLNDTLVRWLVAFNFPGAGLPRVWRPRPKNEDAEEELKTKRANRRKAEIEALEALRKAGFEPTDLQDWAEEMFDTELKPVEVKTPPDPLLPVPPASLDDPAFAEGEDGQRLNALASERAGPAIENWIDEVRRVIQAAETVDALNISLAELSASLKRTVFSENLSDVLALAQLVGRADVTDEAVETIDTADAEWGNLTFEEALDFFRQKVRLPSNVWTETLHQAHDRAFVIAGATSDALLADFKAAIEQHMAGGGTLEDFRRDFDRIVEAHGWSYRGAWGWRSKVIFETNIRTAYQAWRLKQMRDPDVIRMRPYWQYVHGEMREPKVPRPKHVAWDGMVLRHDDPFWQTHYPPNDWQCSCGVRTLSERDLKRLGKDGPDRSPDLSMRKVKDPLTGDLIDVPEGVGFGWGYQPGDSWEQGLVPRELQAPLGAYPTAIPDGLPLIADIGKPFASALLDEGKAPEDYASTFLSQFGAALGRAILWRDKAGQALVISDHLFRRADGRWKIDAKRAREMARLAEAITDPDEIWVDFARPEQGGTVLVRHYIRFDAETNAFVSFNWSAKGWEGATAFPAKIGRAAKPNPDYLERWRKGALIYRRGKE